LAKPLGHVARGWMPDKKKAALKAPLSMELLGSVNA
jgi:hypothetical protein